MVKFVQNKLNCIMGGGGGGRDNEKDSECIIIYYNFYIFPPFSTIIKYSIYFPEC